MQFAPHFSARETSTRKPLPPWVTTTTTSSPLRRKGAIVSERNFPALANTRVPITLGPPPTKLTMAENDPNHHQQTTPGVESRTPSQIPQTEKIPISPIRLEANKPEAKASLGGEKSAAAAGNGNHNGSCAPRRARTLEWARASANSVAVMPCPQGTEGVARWACDQVGNYCPAHPDLSECRSSWLRKLGNELSGGSKPLVRVVKELVENVRIHPIFGGDLPAFTSLVRRINERVKLLLSEMSSGRQRSTLVKEV